MKLPQFTLRDLFWLVALVAMGCGRWISHGELLFEVLGEEGGCALERVFEFFAGPAVVGA
jgi:hypothetical protein